MGALTTDEIRRIHAEYAAGIFRFCWLSTGTREDAEDLLQDFFIRLARTDSPCLSSEKERAWIFSMARNLVIDWHRKRKRRPLCEYREEHDLPTEELNPSDDAETIGHELQSALASLPEEQREVAGLRLWEDLSLREIASIQGVPIQTVASRLRYAIKRLRRHLEPIYSEIK